MPSHKKPVLKNDAIRVILNVFQKHKLQTYSELAKQGATSAILKKLVEEGLITAVGSGIYASIQLDPFVAAVLATAKHYPQAVISGHTALQIHGLGEEYVLKVDVDISRDTSVRNRMLAVHRVSNSRLVGIISMPYHGGKIRIYDIERTLCEAYLLDSRGPIFFKALKRYCAIGSVITEQIAKYDHILKTQVLSHLRQELADG